MTPNILPFLQAADRERPDLKSINTAQSCFALLRLTLAKAGPDWGFVGKTDTMDDGKFTPPDFRPRAMRLQRPDGELETVQIVGLSMDAAWHGPSHRQIKVIANSSANDDPRPEIHGPAQLTPYEIDPQWYRWHNPLIAQSFEGGDPVPAPRPLTLPSYEDLGGDAYWRAEIGVPLQADMAIKTPLHPEGQTLNDGSTVWISRPIFRILHAYLSGQTPDRPAIIRSVRNEWRAVLGLPPL
ncbi:MAG: hypothetical protein ABI665_15165 [Vicinamibacterales bacterium]